MRYQKSESRLILENDVDGDGECVGARHELVHKHRRTIQEFLRSCVHVECHFGTITRLDQDYELQPATKGEPIGRKS